MFIRVIFAINPYDYEDPNECPYLILFDQSYQPLSSQSRLSHLLSRSQNLSTEVNMSAAITVFAYLQQLVISTCHTEYGKKRTRPPVKARRIIDDDDEDDDLNIRKLNVAGMLNKMNKLIRKFKESRDDYDYLVLHIAFSISILIGQHQVISNNNRISITIEALKATLNSLFANNYDNSKVVKYLRDFMLWLISEKGPEVSQLPNLHLASSLFQFILSENCPENVIVDTFKYACHMIEDQLRRKSKTAAFCSSLLSRSFSIIKLFLPSKLAIVVVSQSFIKAAGRAQFRLSAIKELPDYIINERLDEATNQLAFTQIYDVLMLDGTESVRLKTLQILKDITKITKIDKETYRILLLKLRDKSPKVRSECFKLLKSFSISDICDILSVNELITAARYIFKIQSLIPMDTTNDDDKAFLRALLSACLDTNENKLDVISRDLQIVPVDHIPANATKNVIMFL